jgi:hypothetical protein
MDHGYSKRSGSWYRTQVETVAVMNLQRSNYSPRYYINVALWLSSLGSEPYPKEHACHVRTRLERLLDDAEQLEAALDLDQTMEGGQRVGIISAALAVADGLLSACSSLDGCRTSPGNVLVERSLVRAAAVALVQ